MRKIKRLLSIFTHSVYKSRKTQQADLLLLGKILSRQNKALQQVSNLAETEFRVFSQTGDDGIIQYLISKADITDHTFVEFGVENYIESNTRFLLVNDNWSGLVIDGSEKHINFIKTDDICYQHDLSTLCAFITSENINELISSGGISGEIGLLSIDIDGNDYWIWKAINVVSPTIVIVEYNSVLGSERAITVPYNPDFIRTKAHYSNLYFGTSLKALCLLAEEKGYAFVGSNSVGTNAYFVKKERLGSLVPRSAEEGYVQSKFRESRDVNGNLTYLSGKHRYNLIKGLPVYNVITGQVEAL
ncbi:hypothetical protein SAMN04488505_102268 [Chitinophaga rupis]|uniref:Uncharacterized protein n=1 Tax=Chitinophaga rupis TaxID=573321 RepID=A0A1H7Q672_9BACT|nr:hypothetical protein [Chitinophaga rupis]SEL43661.1 hypothetical protein SAMN04488505_102268 [Chitinophaga rupis]